MNTLKYILNKYNLEVGRRMPIEIPNVGRNDLAHLFAELDFKVGVEIGVEQGWYTRTLCKANPGAKIYGVDPWQSFEGYREHISQERLNGFYETTRMRLIPYGNFELIRKFSMEAVHDFDDESLDFVYIDGNHELPFIINDLVKWSEKIRSGGIVSGHDYKRSKHVGTCNHVLYAINAYVRAYRVHPWFLLGRIPGEAPDNTRSWMWVKK